MSLDVADYFVNVAKPWCLNSRNGNVSPYRTIPFELNWELKSRQIPE